MTLNNVLWFVPEACVTIAISATIGGALLLFGVAIHEEFRRRLSEFNEWRARNVHGA